MLKTFAIAASLGALTMLTVAPTAAVAATSDYNVQIKERPAILHHNGSATVVFWLRVRQGSTPSSTTSG
jgi:ABC-type sugar transport system substrate-binding protein